MNKQYFKSAVLFLGIIFSLPLIFMFSDKKSFSEIEKRPLSSKPEISAEGIKDKSYMNDLEKYVSDHFPFRINWIKSKLRTERAMGHELINGIYITDDRLYEKLPDPDYEEIEKSVEGINIFAANYDKTKVFALIAPTSAGVYSDKLKSYWPQMNQKQLISDIYKELSDNVTAIDVYSSMYISRSEYLYYRTDHHWTSRGAFTAYKAAAKKMGIAGYEEYDVVKQCGDFKGTFYSKCLYDNTPADEIDIYKPLNDVKAYDILLDDGIEKDYVNSIYFPEFLETNDKYCLFLGQNRVYTNIKTTADTDRKLLLIKDSYGNSFVPFLIQSYSEIAVLDLRYLKSSITEYVNPNEYDHTLVLYNASTFSTDKNIKTLGLTQ